VCACDRRCMRCTNHMQPIPAAHTHSHISTQTQLVVLLQSGYNVDATPRVLGGTASSAPATRWSQASSGKPCWQPTPAQPRHTAVLVVQSDQSHAPAAESPAHTPAIPRLHTASPLAKTAQASVHKVHTRSRHHGRARYGMRGMRRRRVARGTQRRCPAAVPGEAGAVVVSRARCMRSTRPRRSTDGARCLHGRPSLPVMPPLQGVRRHR
jgi:hypothetical protein